MEEKPPDRSKNGNGNGYPLPKRAGILYSDARREYFPTEEQFITEKDALKDAQVIASYLEKLSIKATLYLGTPDAIEKIRKDKPEIIINLVSSVRGEEYLSATIPATLELLKVPYTGAGMLGESLAYNKFLIKKLLQQNGVPVPHYQLFNTPLDYMDPTLRYPLISKLNEIHGAVEITKDAVSETEKHLRDRLRFLMQTYKQPILVEEFIVGREVTAILLEGLNKKVYIAEKIFKNEGDKYVFGTFEDHWMEGAKDSFRYEKFEDSLLREYVKKAFEIAKMDDYAKFDIRIDSSGRYFFIDSNSNPAFGPKECDCAIANILDLYGITFDDILKRLLINTVRDTSSKKEMVLQEDQNYSR